MYEYWIRTTVQVESESRVAYLAEQQVTDVDVGVEGSAVERARRQ